MQSVNVNRGKHVTVNISWIFEARDLVASGLQITFDGSRGNAACAIYSIELLLGKCLTKYICSETSNDCLAAAA